MRGRPSSADTDCDSNARTACGCLADGFRTHPRCPRFSFQWVIEHIAAAADAADAAAQSYTRASMRAPAHGDLARSNLIPLRVRLKKHPHHPQALHNSLIPLSYRLRMALKTIRKASAGHPRRCRRVWGAKPAQLRDLRVFGQLLHSCWTVVVHLRNTFDTKLSIKCR